MNGHGFADVPTYLEPSEVLRLIPALAKRDGLAALCLLWHVDGVTWKILRHGKEQLYFVKKSEGVASLGYFIFMGYEVEATVPGEIMAREIGRAPYQLSRPDLVITASLAISAGEEAKGETK